MIRHFATLFLVGLSIFGTAPLQEGDNFGVQLLAATGDVRRSLVRFLDQYSGVKAVADGSVVDEFHMGGTDVVEQI